MSQSHKDRISEALKGKHNSSETQFKKGHKPYFSQPWLGKKFSQATKDKMSKARIGKPNFRKKTMGKYKTSSGYIVVYSPNHPHCDNKKYVPEHRLAMEKYLGRFLTKIEEVHHLNRIGDDNRIENLKLFANKSEHIRFHKLNATT